jgi:predicted ATPase
MLRSAESGEPGGERAAFCSLATPPGRWKHGPMVHLRSIEVAAPPGERAGFPFTVPAIAALERIEFATPVTFLAGENGSGKSTFLEALAWAVEAVAAGSAPVERDPTLDAVRPLGRALRPVWTRRTRRGFFLRAEDFFGWVKRTAAERAALVRDAERVRAENPALPEGELRRILSPYTGSAAALESRYGADPDARSHGEQFLAFFGARLVPDGLYLLDEPEAPLSPQSQLGLLSMMKEMVADEAQFIIATHSPILLAFPGATIYSFDEVPIGRVPYETLEHVVLTRDFLRDPERFLRLL